MYYILLELYIKVIREGMYVVSGVCCIWLYQMYVVSGFLYILNLIYFFCYF